MICFIESSPQSRRHMSSPASELSASRRFKPYSTSSSLVYRSQKEAIELRRLRSPFPYMPRMAAPSGGRDDRVLIIDRSFQYMLPCLPSQECRRGLNAPPERIQSRRRDREGHASLLAQGL